MDKIIKELKKIADGYGLCFKLDYSSFTVWLCDYDGNVEIPITYNILDEFAYVDFEMWHNSYDRSTQVDLNTIEYALLKECLGILYRIAEYIEDNSKLILSYINSLAPNDLG